MKHQLLSRAPLQKGSLRRALRNQRGSSLLECLLAMSLFSIAMVMLATMLSSAGIINNRATDLDRSVNDAVNAAEITSTGTGDSVELSFQTSDGNPVASVSANFVEVTSSEGEKEIKLWRFALPDSTSNP